MGRVVNPWGTYPPTQMCMCMCMCVYVHVYVYVYVYVYAYLKIVYNYFLQKNLITMNPIDESGIRLLLGPRDFHMRLSQIQEMKTSKKSRISLVCVFEDSILPFHKHGVAFLQKNLKSINPSVCVCVCILFEDSKLSFVYVYVYWEA